MAPATAFATLLPRSVMAFHSSDQLTLNRRSTSASSAVALALVGPPTTVRSKIIGFATGGSRPSVRDDSGATQGPPRSALAYCQRQLFTMTRAAACDPDRLDVVTEMISMCDLWRA